MKREPPAVAESAASVAVLLVGLGFLWGSAYVAIRLGILAGASPLVFAAVRYAISGAGFAAIASFRREPLPSRRAMAISAGVGGPLILGFYGSLLYSGESSTTAGYAAVLAATVPLMTAAIAYWLLPEEQLGRLATVGLIVGFAGALALASPQLVGRPTGGSEGPVLVLLAFLSFALGSVLLRRYSPEGEGNWQLGIQFLVGGLVIAPFIWWVPGQASLPLTWTVWGSVAFLVVASSVLGYFVYFSLHHRVGPGRANLVAYVIPVIGVAIGSGLFGEPLTLGEVGGFLLVLLGLTLVFWKRQRPLTTGSSGSR